MLQYLLFLYELASLSYVRFEALSFYERNERATYLLVRSILHTFPSLFLNEEIEVAESCVWIAVQTSLKGRMKDQM